MKLLSKQAEELIAVNLEGSKQGTISAEVTLGDMAIDSPDVEVDMETADGNLIAHIRIPNMARFDLLVEKGDIKALKGLMSGSVIKFFIGALMKG